MEGKKNDETGSEIWKKWLDEHEKETEPEADLEEKKMKKYGDKKE